MADKLEIIISGTDQASGVLRGIAKEAGGLGNIAGTVLKAGLLAGAAGLTALAAGAVGSIKSAMESQKAEAQLAAVLKSTGGAAGITADQAKKLAGSLQDVTTFSDEAILSAETMLLQFKNINRDVFPQTTELALDLAQRMGIDATSAAKLLGKALETPGEGLMRLKQAGVAFSDEQEKMIKTMWESGNAAGAQKLILAELEKSIGGAAKAAGETAEGKFTILGNKFDDIKEQIGGALLPAITSIADTLIKELGKPEVKAAIDRIANLAGTIAKGDWEAAKKQIMSGFQNVIGGMNDWFDKPDTQAAIKNIGTAVGQTFVAGIKTLLGQETTSNELGSSIVKLLQNAARGVGTAIFMAGGEIGIEIGKGIKSNIFKIEMTEEEVKEARARIGRIAATLFDPAHWSAAFWRAVLGGGTPPGGASSGFGGISSFQFGGIVPGPIGTPQLALVHGGETITPAGGGATVVFNYQPAFSSASQAEAREVIMPLVVEAMLQARSRQVGSHG